ncbi:kinase-like protein [Obba rivulosa]|uniref:Kinase-like protein n=1 Tax=Obba rivulosa TaxID=1052685 RepID=A0A8E2AIW6_9APHY|nr:kinase-like protein [Obba rivulosa]
MTTTRNLSLRSLIRNVFYHHGAHVDLTFCLQALDALDASDHLRRQCLDLLRKLCGQHRIVPKSFNLLPGTVRRVGTYPEASGAFAEVWKGQYDGQPVALKVFRILKGDDKGGIVQDLKTFCQEAIIWKRLRHRNITPFHGVDSTSFLPRLAMVCDWMFHGTITVYLENNQSADRLRLILDVAEGLQYLHHSDIVHGDLKSHNILVNEQRTACITDFGLAAMHFAGKLKTISVTAGSTRWMSPELIDPEQFDLKKAELSRQSDIYALALVMWEIFTGRIPFYQFTREATVITQVLRGTRPRRPPQATQLGLLDDVWTMIEACWQPVWQDRPDTDALVEGVRKTLAEYAASGAEHTPQTWPLDMD